MEHMDWSHGRPGRRSLTVLESNVRPPCRISASFEVSLFRVGEFVKFDEKLPVHTKRLDGWKISLIPIHDYYW